MKKGQTQRNMEKTAEREWEKAGWKTGVRYKSQPLTELVGRIVLRPYVPDGTKKIGKGEVISICSRHSSLRLSSGTVQGKGCHF